jgi:hypothetical protein
VLLTLALVASRPVTVGSVVVTPYGGFNMLVPVGQRALGVFTPVETLRTGIVGAAVSLSKSWSAFVEYDPGPHLKTGGIAIVYARPAPPARP